MSKVSAKVEEPGKLSVTLEATFTLDEWNKIVNQLDGKYLYPMCELTDAIRDCTIQANKTFISSTWSKDNE